jgi:hypothetical protein
MWLGHLLELSDRFEASASIFRNTRISLEWVHEYDP